MSSSENCAPTGSAAPSLLPPMKRSCVGDDLVEGHAGRRLVADRLGELVGEEPDQVDDLAAVLDGFGRACPLDPAGLVPVAAAGVVDRERDARVLLEVLGGRRLAARPDVQARAVVGVEHRAGMRRPV